MTEPAVDLAESIAGIARVMRAEPSMAADLAPALLLLAESLAETRGAPDTLYHDESRTTRIRRLAVLERMHASLTPGERMRTICRTLGVRRSAFYSLRAEAVEMGLVHELSTVSTAVDNSRALIAT
ncbi:MAG: hypothetical protein ABI885_30405 [Gammaproteobacteria bacterium]